MQRVSRSPYGRAVALLSGAQAVAAGIPMLAAPILGRLYRPEDYGMLALTVAFSAVLVGMSTLQFQHGVLTARGTRHARAVAALSVAATVPMAFFALVVAIVARVMLGRGDAYGPELDWLFVVPLVTLSGGVFVTSEFVMNRRQIFGAMARLNVFAALASVAVTIALGFARWGTAGVMLGYLAGELVRFAGYLAALRDFRVWPPPVGVKGLGRLARRHREFPFFTMPALMLASVNLQVPVFVLGWLGNAALLGAFSRAQRLVALPFILVGTSIGQVFRQRAAEDLRTTGTCRPIYLKTAASLAAISAPPLAALLLFGPQLFAFVLGPNWAEAGEIARILAPMLFLRTIASPLEAVFQLTGHQRTSLALQISFLALTVCGVGIPFLAGWGGMAIIAGFAMASAVVFSASIVWSWRCTVHRQRTSS